MFRSINSVFPFQPSTHTIEKQGMIDVYLQLLRLWMENQLTLTMIRYLAVQNKTEIVFLNKQTEQSSNKHLILEITDSGDKKYLTSLAFRQIVLLYIFLVYLSAKYPYNRKQKVSYENNTYYTTDKLDVGDC